MLRPAIRMAAPIALSALAACSGAARTGTPPGDPPATRRNVMTVDNAVVALETTTGTRVREDVPVSPDRAWALLPAVYEGLQLPLAMIDPAGHELGTGTFRAQGRLSGARLSAFIDCGAAGVTGIRTADTYAVQLQIRTRIEPGRDSQRATLATRVSANGRPANVSGTTVNCPSSGVLEHRIAVALQARAATTP